VSTGGRWCRACTAVIFRVQRSGFKVQPRGRWPCGVKGDGEDFMLFLNRAKCAKRCFFVGLLFSFGFLGWSGFTWVTIPLRHV
jgi:hypothetical protein